MRVARVQTVMDGPPPRVPERVTAGTVLRGKRVVVPRPESDEWRYDVRAADDPYYYDAATHQRWYPGTPVPEGADPQAPLYVAICTEHDWYEWARTKRRPQVREYKAYVVFAE